MATAMMSMGMALRVMAGMMRMVTTAVVGPCLSRCGRYGDDRR